MGLPVGFFDKQRIGQHTIDLVRLYQKRRGKPVTYPLDPSDLFSILFDLETIYDHDSSNERGAAHDGKRR